MKINVDEGVIMQKISFLLLGTSLSFLPQTLNAQCISPLQDCYALGYTQTSCPNGKGVKCPFGNGWYCGGTAAQDCIKLGYDKDCTAAGESGSGQTCNGKYQSCTCDSSYQYTCSGTGYSGGSGSACGGKYTSCTCTSGYEWKDGACQQQILNGAQGDLYYCNGTVVGVKTENMNFYIAMQDLGTQKVDWTIANNQCLNYSFCNNIKGVLPNQEQLLTIYNNRYEISFLLSENNGSQFKNDSYWSSTREGTSETYFVVGVLNGYTGNFHYTHNQFYVRPILSLW